MTVTDRVVDVGDIAMAITEAGQGGRPLLLLHGYTGARNDFEDFIEPLAERGWHVVAPDHRGHGASTKPTSEAEYSLEIFATDVLGLADALGFDRFVVLGHSMGGMLTQDLVLRAPERVVALVLMDTGHGPVAVDPDLIALGVTVARTEGIDVVADVMGASDDGPLTNDAYRRKIAEDPSYKERGDRNLRAASPAMFAAMLQQISSQEDRLERLAGLTMPTLVLVGELDEPFREPSRRMAETIPGARLVVIADGGHSPQFEAPERWWEALSGFLDEVAAADPTDPAGAVPASG
ncbi:MAG TPA: alpha/beta hydrolase [Acidimicrobiales bacterium]